MILPPDQLVRWLEVKKIRNKNTLSSQCIDNISGDENIANLFLNKYNQLYNSVDYDDNEISALCDENVYCIANLIKHKHTQCITVEQVKFALNKLKTGKSDSTDGLISDKLKMAHIFYAAILHYYVPPIDFCYLSLCLHLRLRRPTNVILVIIER